MQGVCAAVIEGVNQQKNDELNAVVAMAEQRIYQERSISAHKEQHATVVVNQLAEAIRDANEKQTATEQMARGLHESSNTMFQ